MEKGGGRVTTLPKVVVLDPLTEEFQRRWQEDLEGLPIELVLRSRENPGDPESAVASARVLITRREPVDEPLLRAAGEELRLVIKLSRWPVGVNLESCRNRGVEVAFVPQLGCISVAEHAMALILACARDLVRSHRGVVAGDYRGLGLVPQRTTERKFAFKWLPVTPTEVYGKILGIIGFGEIGKELAARARAFGMEILYWSRSRAPLELEQELGACYCPLKELLERSDFVSLHVPHTEETEKLIDGARLARMKSTAFLINTARGGVVDETALVEALRSGRIAGAGLDVFVQEPLPVSHPLTELENVILTPHIGGGSGMGRADQRNRVRKLIFHQLS